MANEFVIKNGYLSKADSQVTGSLNITGSLNQIGDYIHTGSVYQSGSKYLNGIFVQTGSLSITGSTTQIGNNTLAGNTLLSGSIIISGSHFANTPTIKVYGDMETDGAIKFLPVSYDIDPTISGSYIFVSGSTDDLYFSQNGAGYANTTRLRWLEGNLYTGLLNGGIITQINTTTFQISSGSGIIVALNSSYNDNPYPTIQYINWGNLSSSIAPLSASYDQQFVAISSSAGMAVIKSQGTPYQDGDYNNFIPIGIVIHQNRSTINAVQTFPGVAYGWKQRSFDFLKAFGPLKISGYTLAQSGSSTRGLVLSGGTAWVDGRNYIVDPNNPSYITEATGIVTSKIYRYYQSGSNWQSNWGYNTNGGAGFTDIDPTQYSNAGTLTLVGSNKWTIQRVFYFPNSATKAFYIYYGNAEYANEADALAAVNTETFNEAPNTTANAIYVGYMLLRNDATFTVPASYTFYAAGLFRASGIGGGGSSGGGSSTLAGLTDVSLSSLANGDLLTYNGITSLWNNTKQLSGSYKITGSLDLSGSLTTNDGVSIQSLTASFVSASSITGSLFGTASWADSASNAINAQTSSFLATGTYLITSSWAQSSSQALTASYVNLLAGPNITINYQSNGIAITGSGGGTPGGSNTQIQFNSASAFSGSSNLTFNYTTNQVQLSGSLLTCDTNLSASISSSNRTLHDVQGEQSIDWANRALYDNTGTEIRVNWSDNSLTDPSSATYEALSLFDNNKNRSVAWDERKLYDSTGNTLALEFSSTFTNNSVRLYGTASLALTASYVNGMITKNNIVTGSSFSGNPKKATITFTTPFPNANYSITITGEDARTWTIESKVSGSFVINSNSNTVLPNNVYWQAISYGEFSQ